ncbi:MAG: type II CRISPR RNA-guided endonuclease Cas9 [Bacteroidales bacterium]|nr:type II CRISPR RNA-guided endonuclease Cas9 [Bacteroidales bacterium]
MAKILGLDLGTNSIGWAVVDNDKKHIDGAGSRILPMDAAVMGDFERGNSVSQTAERTGYRGTRRLRERYLLRRERLLRVLRIIGYLPDHYASQLDRYCHWNAETEPKMAWREGKDGKMEFLFKDSFAEMVAEFRKAGVEGNVPYDWTIYYLRKKALSQPISNEELAWVLMQFNQKRGYNQLRGKNDESDSAFEKSEEKEYHELRVLAVEDSGEKDKKGKTWYHIKLENGWVYKRASAVPLDWAGKVKAFIATYKLDADGKRKAVEQPSLSAPDKDSWAPRKLRLEQDIKHNNVTLGEYIFNLLLSDPSKKIIGENVTTVDRQYYKDELHAILKKQIEYHPELRDASLYEKAIEELYPNNDAYRKSIASRGFEYLLADDILFYQRPLKSKKSLIADCQYEKAKYTNAETGEEKTKPLKGIAKSHPLFQEFRIWQFISNLRIYHYNEDVTASYLNDENTVCDLYDWMSEQKSIDQKSILKYFGLAKKGDDSYRWNYVTDKSYPAGETHSTLVGGLQKCGIDKDFLTKEKELELWHILYSVEDSAEYGKALIRFGKKQGWNEDLTSAFAKAFERLTIYKEKDYGSYSAKAISRLLPLMRCGRYWTSNDIDTQTRERIEHLSTGEVDETIPVKLREQLAQYDCVDKCKGIPLHEACYLVYGRHSESADTKRWECPEDIDDYLRSFRQHSLNNPVVEQVVTETLRTVRDIWKQYGKPDEIHIELGRELKKTREERERMSKSILEGEETNQRIRLLLMELAQADSKVANVRPQSPKQQEILKIYETGVVESAGELPKDIADIRKKMSGGDSKKWPSHSDVIKYKVWLDQKYVSPYTGKPIPLSRLFTPDYEIEHVIPQSRYFDDSLSNKVICESAVNKKKDRELGHEFIVNHHGEKISLGGSETVEVLGVKEYEDHVRRTFANNRTKMKKLLLDEIPDEFIERQMNDSRYISRLMMRLMSNIVRQDDGDGNIEDSATAKNVIACNGSITDRLKKDWGVNDVWNSIVLPRFERLNNLTGSSCYTATNTQGHKIPDMPIELRQGFNKKRIDHRHHAMDAIVIACTTRDHVNLLNNEAAMSAHRENRFGLQRKLRNFYPYLNEHGEKREKAGEFKKPWDQFPQDVRRALEEIIVSFKQNQRVINKTSNKYTAFRDGKKSVETQHSGDSWAIRKPMHKETVFGEVNLQLTKPVSIKEAIKNPERVVNKEIKAKIKEKIEKGYSPKQITEFFAANKDVFSEVANGKVEVWFYTAETNDRYFATRTDLLSHLSGSTTPEAAKKAIESITDSGIRKILLAHLANEHYNAEEAFSPDGLDRMNANIVQLNGGKPHQPIKKVRKFEQANKFSVGETGVKKKKFVEAAQGTNLFFAIYSNHKGERGYATLPLNMVIDLQKKFKQQWKDHVIDRLKADDPKCTAEKMLYILSPGDLVYVPNEDETITDVKSIDKSRIYKMVSCTGKTLYCVPMSTASVIVEKLELESLNKMQTTIDKKYNIQKVCKHLKTDRLGNIISIQ